MQENKELPHYKYILPHLYRNMETIPKESKILDMGCGKGWVTNYLYELGFKNIIGSDVNKKHLEIASGNFPNLKFINISGADNNLKKMYKNYFDVIISIEVIEHIYEPHIFIDNCFEILKYNGILFLSTPYHRYLKNLIISLSGKFDNHFQPLNKYGHIKFWSKNTIRKLLYKQGFKVGEIKGAGRLPYLWKTMVTVAKKDS